jgi:hypothetical protein
VRIKKVNPAEYGIARFWLGGPNAQGMVEVLDYDVSQLPVYDHNSRQGKPLSLGNKIWVVPAGQNAASEEGFYISHDDGATWSYRTPPDNYAASLSALGYFRLLPDGYSIECTGFIPNATQTNRVLCLRKAELVDGELVWMSKTGLAAFSDATEPNSPGSLAVGSGWYIGAFFRGVRRIPFSWDSFFNKQTPFSGPSGNFYPSHLGSNNAGVVIGVQYRVSDDSNRRWRSVNDGLNWSATEIFDFNNVQGVVHCGGSTWMLHGRRVVQRSFDNGASWEVASEDNTFNWPFPAPADAFATFQHATRSPFSQAMFFTGASSDGLSSDGVLYQCSNGTAQGTEWVWDRFFITDISKLGELEFNRDVVSV